MRFWKSRSGQRPAAQHVPAPKRRRTARGVVAVAMIIAMVIGWLTIVGAVVSGTRDLNQAVHRYHTACAFYAAEGGTNMAIREIMLGLDEDGDGIIGSISDDGNDADNPVIDRARVWVHKDVAVGNLGLSSHGDCGATRRKIHTDLEPGTP